MNGNPGLGMVGRGTRKGEKFTDKDHFTVFDCFDGTLLAYFKNSTGITAEEAEEERRRDQAVAHAKRRPGYWLERVRT